MYDEGWYQAQDRYHDFLRRHEGRRVVLLELGVGYNTPVIIKYPFWGALLAIRMPFISVSTARRRLLQRKLPAALSVLKAISVDY